MVFILYLLLHLAGALLLGVNLDYLKDKEIKWRKTYPFLLVGAMFPDIVDKTIGAFIFSTGRWIAHSLIFIFIVSIIGYFLVRNRLIEGTRSIQMFFIGDIVHLTLDLPGISLTWKVIFWPLLGWIIPKGRTDDFLKGGLNPFVIGTELIGLGIVLFLAYKMKFERKQYYIVLIGVIGYISLYLLMYTLLIG